MDRPIHRESAIRLADRIDRGELSPVDVVEHYLDRIDEYNDELCAYTTILRDTARQKAIEAEKAVRSDEETGPLHGVPVALKDTTAKAGTATTYGLPAFEDFTPESNATVVDRLESAGAIVIGKTNVPELAARGTTANSLFGTTSTPFDPTRTAGGSSGGSAAAVAAGLTPVAQGSDGSGSIRIPASCCGVYGFKPSFRRIPIESRPDAFLYHTPFVHLGPITRTVEDAALLVDIMAGPNSRDPFCLPDDGTDYTGATNRSIDGVDVAYSPDFGIFPVDTEVCTVVERAASRFEEAGASVDRVHPEFDHSREEITAAHKTGYQVRVAEIAMNMRSEHGIDLLAPKVELSTEIVDAIEAGRDTSALDYKRADIVRTDVLDTIEEIFDSYDLLATPTIALAPFENDVAGPSVVDGEPIDPFNGWFLTFPYNLTGHPAASIPAGFTNGDLPIGMQLAGRRFDDATVLAASETFERLQPWQSSYDRFD